jgi:hypothetical protein
VPAPIHRRLASHRQRHHPLNLPPAVHPAVILAPSRLLSVADKVCARDVVVVPDLGAAQPAEKFLGAVAVDTASE